MVSLEANDILLETMIDSSLLDKLKCDELPTLFSGNNNSSTLQKLSPYKHHPIHLRSIVLIFLRLVKYPRAYKCFLCLFAFSPFLNRALSRSVCVCLSMPVCRTWCILFRTLHTQVMTWHALLTITTLTFCTSSLAI